MNKLVLIFLFFISFNFIKGLEYGNCNETTYDEAPDEDYCSMLSLSGEYTHCCHVSSDDDEAGYCMKLTDDQYENIVRFKKYYRDEQNDDSIGIDCSSKFVSYSLLAVLAFFF